MWTNEIALKLTFELPNQSIVAVAIAANDSDKIAKLKCGKRREYSL